MKYLIICFCSLLSVYMARAQSTIVNAPNNSNNISVDFTLPAFSVQDTILSLYDTATVYKHIAIDGFGYIYNVGYPVLPQLTIDLNIPKNATDFTVTVLNAVTETLSLNGEIVPMQEEISPAMDSLPDFQKNLSYYLSSGSLYNYTHLLSDPYIAFGERGIALSILPFTYNPSVNQIQVLKQASFVVSYTISGGPLSVEEPPYNSPAKNSYLSGFFENYVPAAQTAVAGPVSRGRYLMIVSPELEGTLASFANYKCVLGFDVTVVNTGVTGTTPSAIKNYLQAQYNNYATRPDFVLLVGSRIPASAGDDSGDNPDNPITDLHYTLLDGTDMISDVFLGRWPCSNPEDLQHIIDKTMYMELHLARLPKKAKFISGSDGGSCFFLNIFCHIAKAYMEREFRREHDDIIDKIFNPLGYACQKLYKPGETDVRVALNDNPLFFVYSGHGSIYSMAVETFAGGINGSFLSNSTNSVYPLVFSFACKTGNFVDNSNIGRAWINQERGGVAFFGSSINTTTFQDNIIEPTVLGTVKDKDLLGEVINLGMHRYWRSVFSYRKYMKAYNLLGDPSLNIKGYNSAVTAPSIIGPPIINTESTYGLSCNMPVTSWGVTPSDVFTITASNAISATVATTGINGQSGVLTAVVNGINIHKTIWACQPVLEGPSVVDCQVWPFSFSQLPSGAEDVTWSTSCGLCIVSTLGAIWVKGEYPGPAEISVSFTYNGERFTYTKQVVVDPPSLSNLTLHVVGVWWKDGVKYCALSARDEEGREIGWINVDWHTDNGEITPCIEGGAVDRPLLDNYTCMNRVACNDAIAEPDTSFNSPAMRFNGVLDYLPPGEDLPPDFPPPPDDPPAIPAGPCCAVLQFEPSLHGVNEANVTCSYRTCSGEILSATYTVSGWVEIYSAPLTTYNAYPNPVSSLLHIEPQVQPATLQTGSTVQTMTGMQSSGISGVAGQCNVQLISVSTGALALQQTVPDFDTAFDLDVSAVPDGLYMLRLLRNNELVDARTILVAH